MNKVKKKLLKICIITTVIISSIKCFAMNKNSEDIFKNNENNISQISYYDEDSYNSIKTPVNKINNKKINEEEESLFSENNKYLNNKKNSENIFFKNNENNISQISYYDEDSYNSIKTPVNEINIKKINEEEEELSLSYKINYEEELFNKNNEYLNKKTTRKSEDILEKDEKYKNLNNQKDTNLIKTPVMKKRDLFGFQDNKNNSILNNKNFNNINPSNMLFNNLYQYTSKKNNIINNNSNEYENNLNLNKKSQNSYNQIDFNSIQNLKNELIPNNHIIKNNFKEKEKDNSSVKANFGEDEEYSYEGNLNLPKILTKEKFLMEEYKKRIICTILKKYLKDEINEVIKKHILNSTIKNKYDILKNIDCNILFKYNPNNLSYDDYSTRTTNFFILLPDNIKKIFKNKDEEYRDLLLDIISSYKIIFKKSIVKTLKELPTLRKDYFDSFYNENGVKQCCNKLVQNILGNQKFDKTKVYDELKNFNENDYCYKYFTNFNSLINFIYIKTPKQNTQNNITDSNPKNYENIFRINISDSSCQIDTIDNINIPQEKRNITFKDYDDFFKELIQIDFNTITDFKNELIPNNHIIKNNFEEKEKDNSSVKANFGEDEEYSYEENLDLPKISTKEKFLMEEYKKRIICTILKKYLKDEINAVIKKNILNSTIENKNNILKNIDCNVTFDYKLLDLDCNNYNLKSTTFSILLPDNIKKIFENKDEKYRDLLLDIISNYKIILQKSIVETLKELPKLTEEYFDDLSNEKGTKQSCNKLVKNILGNQEFDKTKIYDELRNFNINDYCYKYFTNFKYLIFDIHLKVLDQDTTQISNCKSYKNIFKTDLAYSSCRIDNIDNINIPQEKRIITFKDYQNFWADLNQIKFNS